MPSSPPSKEAPVPFPRAAYYARIGLDPATALAHGPTLHLLRLLIVAHMSHIPFETLDCLLGRPVSIDPSDVYEKLIVARRGGYCVEHNTLFYHALVDAGFTGVYGVSGRVTWVPTNPLGLTHMVIVLPLRPDGTAITQAQATLARTAHPAELEAAGVHLWCVDVSFGAALPQGPLRLWADLAQAATPQRTPAGVFRLRPVVHRSAHVVYHLEVEVAEGRWREAYCFSLNGTHVRDYRMLNTLMYTSSFFTYVMECGRVLGELVPLPSTAEAVVRQQARAAALPDPALAAAVLPTVEGAAVFLGQGSRTLSNNHATSRTRDPLDLHAVGFTHRTREVFTSPAQLYDWLVDSLGLDLAQTRVPKHTVTKEEFVEVAKHRMVCFGGSGEAGLQRRMRQYFANKL